jgi:hypothetical protein
MKTLKKLFFIAALFTIVSCNNSKPVGYYHVLLLEYDVNTPQTEMINDILHFKDIPDVLDVAIGKIEPNERNTITYFGYSIVLTFKDKQGLDNYLKHPYHIKTYNKYKSLIKSMYTANFEPLKMN